MGVALTQRKTAEDPESSAVLRCDFFGFFSARLDEISLVLTLLALLEIVSACDIARDVFVTFHEYWIF